MALIDEIVCPICVFCSTPLYDHEWVSEVSGIVCQECFNRLGWPTPIPKKYDSRVKLADKVVYIWEYSRVKDVIHRLKFTSDWRLRELIEAQLLRFIEDNLDLFTQADAASYVPMHWFKHLFLRPIDLAGWVAKRVAMALDIQVLPLIKTSLLKPTLHRLRGADARRLAIKNRFRLIKMPPREIKELLLIDDVITTGATLSEVCWLIRRVRPDLRITVFSLCG